MYDNTYCTVVTTECNVADETNVSIVTVIFTEFVSRWEHFIVFYTKQVTTRFKEVTLDISNMDATETSAFHKLLDTYASLLSQNIKKLQVLSN